MWWNKLLKNIYIHNLKLLNLIYIVVFDVETALENVKVAIQEWLFYSPLQLRWIKD